MKIIQVPLSFLICTLHLIHCFFQLLLLLGSSLWFLPLVPPLSNIYSRQYKGKGWCTFPIVPPCHSYVASLWNTEILLLTADICHEQYTHVDTTASSWQMSMCNEQSYLEEKKMHFFNCIVKFLAKFIRCSEKFYIFVIGNHGIIILDIFISNRLSFVKILIISQITNFLDIVLIPNWHIMCFIHNLNSNIVFRPSRNK